MKAIRQICAFVKGYTHEYAELLRLGFPVLLTQFGVIIMSFADTMMVGAYGVDQLAASAFVNSIFLIPLVMLSGLASGLTPLVGASYSRGEHDLCGRVTRAGIHVNLLVSGGFTLIMAGIYFLVDRMGQAPDILPIARPYYLTLLATIIPMSLFNSLSQMCNGVTDTRTPMWFILASIVLNILGNWLLIFGNWGCPRMGLTGAGVATLISRLVGVIGLAVALLCSRRYAAYRRGFFDRVPLPGLRRRVWSTSYPIMIQTGIECSLWSFGAVVCGWFGKVQLAAYQIVNTIGQLGFMTYLSFGNAVSIRVANFAGVEDDASARLATRAGLHINYLLAAIASMVMAIFARYLISSFNSDPDVIQAGMLFILPLVLYQFLDATQLTYINAIRGTSRVQPLLGISIVSYVVVGVPILLLLACTFDMESVGVYYSFDVALFMAALLAYIVFRRTPITSTLERERALIKKV